MYFVYLLKSLKDNRFYIGQSEDPNKRLVLHNSGRVKSTKHRLPFELIGFQQFDKRGEARWFEYNLKNHSDRKMKFIDSLILKASGPWNQRKVSDPEGLRPGGR